MSNSVIEMKAGDLVTPLFPKNHAGICYRLYDIPNRIIFDGSQHISRKISDKFYRGEVGILLGIDNVLNMGHIFTQKNVFGWINVCNIIAV
jgi:hypothetical protein